MFENACETRQGLSPMGTPSPFRFFPSFGGYLCDARAQFSHRELVQMRDTMNHRGVGALRHDH